MKHKISVACPVKNEENYLPIHFENFIDKVDEVVYCDTGSTDGTEKILSGFKKKYPDKVTLLKYDVNETNGWQEGVVRQFIVDSCRNDYILISDADEVIDDNFNDVISKHDIAGKTVSFLFVPFWKNLSTVRCNVPNDERWYPNNITRLFDRRKYCYEAGGRHSFLNCKNKEELFDNLYLTDIKYFHLHYGMFKRVKPNDYRLKDLGLIDYWGTDSLPEIIEDERFDRLSHDIFGLKLMQYDGLYPRCLKKFLKKNK